MWLSVDSDVMKPPPVPAPVSQSRTDSCSREAIARVRDAVTQLAPGTFGFDVAPQDVRAVSRPDR